LHFIDAVRLVLYIKATSPKHYPLFIVFTIFSYFSTFTDPYLIIKKQVPESYCLNIY